MAVAQPLDFEIDFVKNPISGLAAWFYVIILKFIFTAIFEIKNHEKNPWHQKNFCWGQIMKDVREPYDETKFNSFPNSRFKKYVCSKLQTAQ